MWLRLMIIAFITNGLGPFGLKVLAEMHLSTRYQYQYLALWYFSGFVLLAAVVLRKRMRPFPREIALGGVMGSSSLLGQLGIVMALNRNVPGYVVFPLVVGGSLFFVVLGGVALFKEKIGIYGVVGIALGIAALVILAAP